MPEQDKQRQPGESIFAWRRRIRNNNKFGQVSTLDNSVVTADRPEQKPTGNWFQRLKKFIHPYGTEADVSNAWQNEENSLASKVTDRMWLRDPKNAQSAYDEIQSFRNYPDVIQNWRRRTDEYRGNYASSLFPQQFLNMFRIRTGGKNSNPNDITSQLWRWYSRKWGYNSSSSPNNVSFSGNGTDIIDLDKNVIRLTPRSKQSTALFNEFVESKLPSVHSASEYQQGKVKRFGDLRNIPVENISLYAGIEDGHFKLDSLQNFNPETTIYPARNIRRDVLPITALKINQLEGERTQDDGKSWFWTKLRDNIDPYWYIRKNNVPEEISDRRTKYRNMVADKVDSLINVGNRAEAFETMMDYPYNNNMNVWLRNWNNYYRNSENYNSSYEPPELKAMTNSLSRILRSIPRESDETRRYFYIDTNGNEHPISDYNASILDSKMVFGNPNGGKFIGRIQDISQSQLDSLNNWLFMNPSWLIRPDLGSFAQYRLDNPSLKEYLSQYFEHPNPKDPNVFTVGTTEPNEVFKKGGVIKDQNKDVIKLSRFKSKLHK